MKKLILVALFLSASLPAMAQTPPSGGAAGGKGECKEKIEQICPGVQPGGGRIKDCLKEHNTTLEQVCPGAGEHRKHGQQSGSGSSSPSQAPTAQAPASQE